MIKLALILTGALLAAQPSFAGDGSRLIGVWKLLSFRSEFQDGSPTRAMLGEHPSGYIIVTKEGRMMSVIEGENRKAPSTDADRASLRCRICHQKLQRADARIRHEKRGSCDVASIIWYGAWQLREG